MEKAQNTAILLISVEGVDSTLLKKIHKTTSSLIEEEIALTDSSNNLIYSNNTHYLSAKMLLEKSYNSSPNYFAIGEKLSYQMNTPITTYISATSDLLGN